MEQLVPDAQNEFYMYRYSAGWVCGPLASVLRKIGIDVVGLDANTRSSRRR